MIATNERPPLAEIDNLRSAIKQAVNALTRNDVQAAEYILLTELKRCSNT